MFLHFKNVKIPASTTVVKLQVAESQTHSCSKLLPKAVSNGSPSTPTTTTSHRGIVSKQLKVKATPASPSTSAKSAKILNLSQRCIGSKKNTIHPKVKLLREEFLQYYGNPDVKQLPYNENMARTYKHPDNETKEEVQRRTTQAEKSRSSRGRTKYADDCIESENIRLQKLLFLRMEQLLDVEQTANSYLMEMGVDPIKWNDVL